MNASFYNGCIYIFYQYYLMKKVIFILSSISSGLKFWAVNHILLYENSELNVFRNMKSVDKISYNWPNDLFQTDVYKTLESFWQSMLQWSNISSLISRWGTFPPLLSLVILFSVFTTNVTVSSIRNSRENQVLILNVILFSVLFHIFELEHNSKYSVIFDDILKIISNM